MTPPVSPPAFARALVRFFSNPEDRAFLLQDLADRYREVAETNSVRAAKRWYWKQAVSAVPWALRPDRIGWQRWAGVVGDLRLGLRTLRRRPLYAVGVAGTLGLGLAAAIMIFAVAWNVWLAPMQYPDPDRVVRLYEFEPLDSSTGSAAVGAESRRQLLSAPLLKGFRAHSWRTIEAVSAVLTGLRGEWARDGDTQDVSSVAVSPEFFGILGIVPTLGRLPADLEAEAEVILTEGFWRTDFGADPDVVGSEMILGGRAFRVVGVAGLPSGYPGRSDVVTVNKWGGNEPRNVRFIEAIARVRPGYSAAEARAEMNAFVAALGRSIRSIEGGGWTSSCWRMTSCARSAACSRCLWPPAPSSCCSRA